MNYYEILGVEINASAETIKTAMRNLAKIYHPDVSKEPDAVEKFQAISEAYSVISDPEKRNYYDKMGMPDKLQFVPASPPLHSERFVTEKWVKFFGTDFKTNVTKNINGADIVVPFDISYDDIILGAEKRVFYNPRSKCPTCNGIGVRPKKTLRGHCEFCKGFGRLPVTENGQTKYVLCPSCGGKVTAILCESCHGEGGIEKKTMLDIRVPQGADSNSKLVYKGLGNDGAGNGKAGDLVVQFNLIPHQLLRRNGDNLIVNMKIPEKEFRRGYRINIPPLGEISFPHIQDGTDKGTVTIKGKGLYNPKTKKVGDLIVMFIVVQTPSTGKKFKLK